MEWLPLEIVELIAQYLTPQELAACCTISVGWRDIFNQNNLWKPHCNKETAEYLETTKCRVQPEFVSPDLEDSTLSPVCHWWMCYMRENHLLNNWRQGRSVTDEVEVREHSLVHPGSSNVFISHEYVVRPSDRRMMLWDVRDTPVYIGDPFCLLFGEPVYWCGMISDNMFSVVQGLYMQVYCFKSILDEKWNLKHLFFLDGIETMTRSNARSQYAVHRILITGNICAGCTIREKDILHIWDMQEGKKLKTVECSTFDSYNEIYGIVKSAKPSLDLIIIVQRRIMKTYRYSLNIYSLKELDFLPFSVSHDVPKYLTSNNFQCVLQDRFVAVTIKYSIFIYDYLTSQLVITSTPTHHLLSFYCNIFAVDNRIFFSKKHKLEMIFNTSTLKIEPLTVRNTRSVPKIYGFREFVMGNFFITLNGRSCDLGKLEEIQSQKMYCG